MTYEENREKIRKRLWEINTTHDRDEAYQKCIDYILSVAEKSYRQGIIDRDYWYDESWSESDTIFKLTEYGVTKTK